MKISSSSESPRTNRPGRIVCLGAAARSAVKSHFNALSPPDRRLRFGLTLADAAVDDYVERSLQRAGRGIDLLVGYVDANGTLLGVAHLARDASNDIELGLSVLAEARRIGVAGRLLDASVRLAHALGARELVMDYLPENAAIVALARRAGMRFVADRDGSRRARMRPDRDGVAESGHRAIRDDYSRRSANCLSSSAAQPSRERTVEWGAPILSQVSSSTGAVSTLA